MPAARSRVAEAGAAVAVFYRRPLAWLALIVTAALLTFGGGAVMFWFHAIFRGEQGPAIGDAHHWLLDSSIGFVALTPLTALILPFGVWAGAGTDGRRAIVKRAYVASVAVVFTLTTGPGPFLHNIVAGARTPLADAATVVFGHDPSVAARNMHVHDRSPLAEGLLQVVVGFPVYVLCTWIALVIVRSLVARTRCSDAPASPARAVPPGTAVPLESCSMSGTYQER